MKIVVVQPGGKFYCKSDNTLNHNNSDYYCPEGVTAMEAVPCIYTHIDKAGKCVAERFSGRYFSTFAYGCLLTDRSADADMFISAGMDFTSILDMSWRPLETLSEGGYKVDVNQTRRFEMAKGLDRKLFTDAICMVTRRATLRIGDIIAIELGSAGEVKAGDILTMDTPIKKVDIKIF